jgi:hypothetical protein
MCHAAMMRPNLHGTKRKQLMCRKLLAKSNPHTCLAGIFGSVKVRVFLGVSQKYQGKKPAALLTA